MKSSWIYLSLMMYAFCSACGFYPPAAQHKDTNLPLKPLNRTYEDGSLDNKPNAFPALIEDADRLLPKSFTVKSPNLHLNAHVDDSGLVTIYYPKEWRGKASLVRFDGLLETSGPFSHKHCEEIRNLSKGAGVLIRTAYRSYLQFEVPSFLSTDFMDDVSKSAQAVGLNFSAFILKNFFEPWKSRIEIAYKDGAITPLTGDTSSLEQELHSALKGKENQNQQRKIIVSAADLICDLISGDAVLSMIYPINGEERVVKVTYDLLEVKL